MPGQLLKYVLFLLVGFAAIDFVAGLLLDAARDAAPDGRYHKARYSLEENEEDILILGSSRGEMNYAPFVFEDSLQRKCWNASRGGQGLPYFRAIQEATLERFTPEIVILNAETFMIEAAPEYDQVGFLRPFASEHPEIRPILHDISKYEWLNLHSRLYAYNSSYYYLLRPFLKQGLDGDPAEKGWKPKDGAFNYPIKPTPDTLIIDRPINTTAKALFDELVRRFSLRNCVLILVVSPNYGEATLSSPSLTYYEQIAKEYDIAYFNYASDPEFVTSPEYYIDYQHLNRQGAERFSRKVARDIKAYLQTRQRQGAWKDKKIQLSERDYSSHD